MDVMQKIIDMRWWMMVAILIAVLLLTLLGCTNTSEAIDEFRETNVSANLMLKTIAETLEIVQSEMNGGETLEAVSQLLLLTQGVSSIVTDGAEAAQKIKDAEIEDWEEAALAAAEAGTTSLIGPGMATQIFGTGGVLTLLGLGQRKINHQSKRRGQAEVRAALAERDLAVLRKPQSE